MYACRTEQSNREEKYLPTLYPTSVLSPLLGMLQGDTHRNVLKDGDSLQDIKERTLCFQSREEIAELLLL